MKIKEVEIKNFKFHTNLQLDVVGKNCLIYGENGTGKSSIYEALYSNFYYQKRLNKALDIRETFKNRENKKDDLEVNITFDNEKVFNRKNNLIDDIDKLVEENPYEKNMFSSFIEPTLYLANEKVLSKLTKENFYIALQDTLIEHFPKLELLTRTYNEFENLERLRTIIIEDIEKKESKKKSEIENLDKKIRTNFEDKILSANNLFKIKWENSCFFNDKINEVLKKFDENFRISFKVEYAKSEDSDILGFSYPNIRIMVNDIEHNGKLNNHFNEAKLKLISVAIYFLLAKEYEAKSDYGLKVLVLDDFLTSLDMANRKLIIKYILENFQNYQKLILTHNLQFFNMTRKIISIHSENEKNWKVQKLFVYNNQAFLYDKDLSYLPEANDRLKNGDLHSTGNFIRKEFERIITEFEQLLELGRVEDLQNIIDALTSKDKHYIHSHKVTNNFYKQVQTILDDSQKNEQVKISSIESAFKPLSKTEIEFTEKIKNLDGPTEDTTIKTLIKRGEFYKNFILNPTSHDDIDAEIYEKECKNGINLLKYLNKIIANLKGTKYE